MKTKNRISSSHTTTKSAGVQSLAIGAPPSLEEFDYSIDCPVRRFAQLVSILDEKKRPYCVITWPHGVFWRNREAQDLFGGQDLVMSWNTASSLMPFPSLIIFEMMINRAIKTGRAECFDVRLMNGDGYYRKYRWSVSHFQGGGVSPNDGFILGTYVCL